MLYKLSIDGITSDMLKGFFVNWPNPPSPQTHLKLLKKSSKVVIAVDVKTNHVAGFITAISDGVLSAYIPFLEVLPEYQSKGISKELVNRMLKELEGIYMVDLCCANDLVAYYEKLGMSKTNGMILRNYSMQSGN